MTGLDPSAFLQLAGHPLRWRLLRELAHSDRTVHELTQVVAEPQNLVSYHLGKLRGAGLVSARRSSADRRDAYYTADLGRIGHLLSATGGALHPALHLTPSLDVPTEPARVLFLCTGNSARSPMAEALIRARSGGVVEARSAGSHPKPLHPNAVRVMRDQHGIDLTGHEPTHVDSVADQHFDWVVSLCDRVREVCPELPAQPETVHWSIRNPAEDPDHEATYPLFRDTAAELDRRIGFLLGELSRRAPDLTTQGAQS